MNKRRILVLAISADWAGRRGRALVAGIMVGIVDRANAETC